MKSELIADEKSRCRTFLNREKGMKKKLRELSILCDVKACMILYGPNGKGHCLWPENDEEVTRVIDMVERKEDGRKRKISSTDFVPKKMKIQQFSYEELMEIINGVDKKLEDVQNLIDLKKSSMSKNSSLSAIAISPSEELEDEFPDLDHLQEIYSAFFEDEESIFRIHEDSKF